MPNIRFKNGSPNRLTSALRVKLAPSDLSQGIVTGYASAFGGPADSYGEIIQPGAFSASLKEIAAEGITIPMLWSHRSDELIGHWTDLKEDDFGLLVRGQLNLNTSRGKDAHQHLKQGDVSGMSIGFFVAPGGSKAGLGGTTILTEIKLVEVSITVFPANPRARVDQVKSKAELADILRDAGLSKTAATRAAAGGWPALSGGNHQKAIDLAAEISRATANLRTMK